LNGDVLRCSSCDSVKHLLLKCPHSWEIMANFGEESIDDESTLVTVGKLEQSEEESEVDEAVFMAADEECKLLGGFGWNYAILDTGCNKSVAGTRWTEEYIKALSNKDRQKVKRGGN